MSAEQDYDIQYTPCEKPEGALVGVPSKSSKLGDGWVTNMFRCGGKLYVRAVQFGGPTTETKWFEVTAKWKHCEFPFDIMGRERTSPCRGTPAQLATVTIDGTVLTYRVCWDCVLTLRMAQDIPNRDLTFTPLDGVPA